MRLGTLLGCDAVKGSNFSKWCYKPFDDLVVKGRSTTDVAARTKAYTDAPADLRAATAVLVDRAL